MKYLYYNWSRYVCLVAFMCSIADRQPIIFTELYWFKLFPKIIFRPKLLERIFKYPVKVSVAKLWNFINDFKMLTVKRTDLIQISTHLSLVIEPDQASDILHCFSMRGITLINRVGRFNATLSYISFLASHTSLLLTLRTGCSTENLLKWLTAKESKMLIYCCILFPITIAPVQGLRDIL